MVIFNTFFFNSAIIYPSKELIMSPFKTIMYGRIVAQEFLGLPLTAAIQVQSHYSPHGISDGQSSTVTGFRSIALIRFVPIGIIPPVLHSNPFVS